MLGADLDLYSNVPEISLGCNARFAAPIPKERLRFRHELSPGANDTTTVLVYIIAATKEPEHPTVQVLLCDWIHIADLQPISVGDYLNSNFIGHASLLS